MRWRGKGEKFNARRLWGVPLADRLGILPDEMGARFTLRDLLRYHAHVERERIAQEQAQREFEREQRRRGRGK